MRYAQVALAFVACLSCSGDNLPRDDEEQCDWLETHSATDCVEGECLRAACLWGSAVKEVAVCDYANSYRVISVSTAALAAAEESCTEQGWWWYEHDEPCDDVQWELGVVCVWLTEM